jgi:hypothetical protein
VSYGTIQYRPERPLAAIFPRLETLGRRGSTDPDLPLYRELPTFKTRAISSVTCNCYVSFYSAASHLDQPPDSNYIFF